MLVAAIMIGVYTDIKVVQAVADTIKEMKEEAKEEA